MITKADDFPVHQTPEPIAYAGTDRNFYDRYFFNGYSCDGEIFFAAAMGFYPQLGIVDAAFCMCVGGKQHNIRASRHSSGDRLDMSVGPIEIRVIEPLREIQVLVTDNESGITADLMFSSRHDAIEEPRFTRRNGTRLFMDYTRMTQNGAWSGTVRHGTTMIAIEPAQVMGTRDRSWGIRPVGAPDSQPPVGGNLAQFFWLWAPCNFPAHASFAHSNDDSAGLPWNRRGVIAGLEGEPAETDAITFNLNYQSGTRRIASATIEMGDAGTIALQTTGFKFYMSGLGYMHPKWGHGTDHGPLAVAYDTIDTSQIDDNAIEHLHIQSLCTADLTIAGQHHHGSGILEQLLLGPHEPSGFKGLMDPAV
jgi:hypothetical protein